MASPKTVDEATEEVPAVPSVGEPTGEVPIGPDDLASTGRPRRRRWIILAVVAVLVAGAAVGIWLGTSGSSGPGVVTTTEDVAVTTGTMKQTVAASGTIEPATTADLDFAVSGKVTAVSVSVGQTVTTGQVLATVDPAALQATIDSAQASLTAAQAKLSSDEAADASTSQILSDQASVTSAQSQLTSDETDLADASLASTIEAQQNLADAQLTSPISGTVVSVGLTGGQSVTAGSTTEAITVLNSGSYQVTGTLTSTEATKVKVGDQAQVTVTGADGTLAGTVARVGPVDTSSSSYTYPVVVALPAGSHGIASGSSAQLVVTLAEVHDVRVVPTSAVHTGDGTDYVETLATGQETRRPVDVGIVGAEYTQITTVLPEGTEVVLADLAEAVPSSSTDSTSTSVFGGTGSTGDGFTGGAGFAGGGRTG